MSNIDVSVVLVTYNPGALLEKCLDALNDEITKLKGEVIVVDNSSSDGTPDLVEKQHADFRLIRNADNRGFAAATNQGLATAQGEFLLLLNPDVVISSGTLTKLIGFLSQHSDIGIVGPRTYDNKGNVALSAYRTQTALAVLAGYLKLHMVFPIGRLRRRVTTSDSATPPFQVGWVQGSCLMMRREVYETIGGLDEGFFLFNEEPDYCERAREAGWPTYYLPGASVTHYESTSVSKYPITRIRHYHLGPLHYFRKRRCRGAVALLKLGFTIEMLVKLVLRKAQLMAHRDPDTEARLEAYRLVLGDLWFGNL